MNGVASACGRLPAKKAPRRAGPKFVCNQKVRALCNRPALQVQRQLAAGSLAIIANRSTDMLRLLGLA